MAHSNEKLPPNSNLYTLLSPVVFSNVRSTSEKVSRRKRQCYGTGKTIAKGEKYINHQFRYDNRILTVSFCVEYFYNSQI